MAGSDEDHGMSKRLIAEDQGWSGTQWPDDQKVG
jgi:hypothetical protein